MPKVESRSLLVTGASSGIGYALAAEALRRDWRVWGCSRRCPEDLVSRGLRHLSVDLADLESLRAALPDFLAGAPDWDLVVLNAGTLGAFGDVADVQLSDMQDVWNTNVLSNKLLLDALLASGAELRQVVAVSSGAGLEPRRGVPAYSVSKAALNMLIRLYALELTATHFCLLLPGIVDTPMQGQLTAQPEDDRYPLLQELKRRREADQLVAPGDLATRVLDQWQRFPEQTVSGGILHLASLPGRSTGS